MAGKQKNEYLRAATLFDKQFLSKIYSDEDLAPEVRCSQQKIQNVFGTKDIKEQIIYLKDICSLLSSGSHEGTSVVDGDAIFLLDVLVEIYLNCPPKNTIKRILVSAFQGYKDKIGTLVYQKMTDRVKMMLCTQPIQTISYRDRVNMIYGLMENFSLGEKSLTQVFVSALKFLSDALDKFLTCRRSDLSPVQNNELMHHCLATIQAANKLIQKCAGKERTSHETEVISRQLSKNIIQILRTENFMLDCKTSGSMCLTLLMKINMNDQTVLQIKKLIFEEDMNIETPMWLQNAGISDVTTLTSTSCLSVWYGVLAQLDVSDLLQDHDHGKSILLDIILDKIMLTGSSCCDTSGKLLTAKTVLMWTSKALTCIKSDLCPVTIVPMLNGSDVLLQKVLNFVWTIWEDPTEVIRFTAKDIFEMVIKIHTTSSNKTSDEFLMNLTNSILSDVSWSCKGKYGTLRTLVEFIRPSALLLLSPSLPADVLRQLREQTLACYGSDLYERLFLEHYKEVSLSGNMSAWLQIWVYPVIHCLLGSDRQQKLYTIEYILPKLLKTGKETLQYMITTLSDNSDNTQSHLGALIMCLRRARVIGLLNDKSSDSSECLYGVVSISVVKQALCHIDDQARLDAFALLCENHKTSEAVHESEFKLMKYFIQWNLNNQSSSFRQHFISHIKKFFLRFKESEASLCKKVNSKNNRKETEEILNSYKEFGGWLFRILLHSLYPGSAFARRTTALSALAVMVDVLDFGCKGGFSLEGQWTGCHIQTLMECLTDTFEDNKLEALAILKYCFKHRLFLKDQIMMHNSELFDVGMELAGSNRPQDCTTAAYLLRILILQPEVLNFLLNSGNSVFSYLSPKFQSKWSDVLKSFRTICDEGGSSWSSLLLLSILLYYLRDQLDVARSGLFMAAATKPMYPTLHCIRYLLFDVELRKLSQEELQHWRPFIEDLLQCCLDISDVVSPVVQNSSPEGNVPVEAIQGTETVSSVEAEKCAKTITLMPEYLVVCCWRNVKEVSLLLGQLTSEAPISSDDEHTSGLISIKQNIVIGEYFKKQLMESIHRGAFELACAGFVKQCEMLWKCNIKQLHQLPRVWLEQVIVDIKCDDERNKLCATRRSAGIPFFVQTLVTTELHSTGRPCFQWTMNELLQLALKDDDDTKTFSNSKVHALNILRALFKDSRLGEVVTVFVADGLRAAILGFQSPFWAVRNCATLLLSTMMTRIFGVKRSKDESNMSKKNCQTGRQFFHQYPSLYPFLLAQLEAATHNIGDTSRFHLHPGLYPVLMVLGRLFQSPLEGADTTLSLAAFVPYIVRCSTSPVLKTRLMAAKALQPLVQKGQLQSVLTQLLSMIPELSENCVYNHIHGILIQVSYLLDMLPSMPDCVKLCRDSVLSTWKQKCWLLSRRNPCYMTRQMAFQMTEKFLHIFCDTDDKCLGQIQTCLQQGLDEDYLEHTYSQPHMCSVPGYVEYVSVLSKIDLKFFLHYYTSETHLYPRILAFLKSDVYDVRLATLDVLKQLFCGENKSNILLSETCTKCMELLLPDLLHMALYKERHFECQIKVFEVLDKHPSLQKKWGELNIKTTTIQVLEDCLKLIESSTRDEVNAAIITFTRWLLPDILQNWNSTFMDVVGNLIDILSDSVGMENSGDLQLSVAMVIQHNADSLLRTSSSNLGASRMFEFWEMLMILQQENDQDIRMVISQTLQKIGQIQAVQPSLTLDYLVKSFVNIHSETMATDILMALLSWMVKTDSITEDPERLFDRSEMNTFREDVLFYQIILKYCLYVIARMEISSEHRHEDTSDMKVSTSSTPNSKSLSPDTTDYDGWSDQLCLVFDEDSMHFNYCHKTGSSFDLAKVVTWIDSFLQKHSYIYEEDCDKKKPFTKTSAYQESLLDRYKVSVLQKIKDILCKQNEDVVIKRKVKDGNLYPSYFTECLIGDW